MRQNIKSDVNTKEVL